MGESKPLDILQRYWGYPGFRPLQEEIIQSVLEGQDTLALLPTGGGKSICFQVPGLVRKGVCLVISPLIALMKDQVYQLTERGIPAAAIYSGMHYREIDRLLDNAAYGGLKFLYVSPERLKTELAVERIKKMPINVLAVDEAHCISQWGYDFRPPYLEIAEIRQHLPAKTPVLALTATAIPEVVTDIQEKLNFPKQNIYQASFERPNLTYLVRQTENKLDKLLEIVRKTAGSGIIYVRNRRKTKEIAQFLQRRQVTADHYHAGLNMETRSRKQDNWIQGKIRFMVATNAFGMGIDKPDVRTVVHLELPDSLEAYFQEAGRAGRDAQPSFAVLLYHPQDRQKLEKQFQESYPSLEELRRVYRALGSYFQLAIGAGAGIHFDFDLADFCQKFKLEPVPVHHSLVALEKAGWLHLSESVFQPASLMIKVEKEELYDFQLKNPKLDKLLRTILRTHQGAFSNYIHLKEHQLARFLELNAGEIRNQLSLLHERKIIDYIPQKDQPQILFLPERVNADTLDFDQAAYRFRKERHARRLEAAFAYAEEPVCRSQQLLHYFGQSNAPECGKCEICRRKTTQQPQQGEQERYIKKVTQVLRHESLPLEEILEAFSMGKHELVKGALQFMLQQELVEQDADQKFRLKK